MAAVYLCVACCLLGTLGDISYATQFPLDKIALVKGGPSVPRIILEQIPSVTPVFQKKDVVTLSVKIAPAVVSVSNGKTKYCSVAHPGPAAIKLGLYQSSKAGGPLTLIESTDNIVLSATQVLNGLTVRGGVQLPAVKAGSGQLFVGIVSNNSNICLLTNGKKDQSEGPYTYVVNAANPDGTALPNPFSPSTGTKSNPLFSPEFQAQIALCPKGHVVGDPVFHGFNGQLFSVKGENGRVFNVLSAPDLVFNNRFLAIQSQSESMTATEMREVRAQFKHTKLLDLANAAANSANRPPVTTAWSHNGTYMGECGLRLGESQLYIQPGTYAQGFAAITLNGVALPVSAEPVELEGDMTVTHASAYSVTIATRDVRFTIVNSDRFVNIEHASVRNVNAQLSGLLGQTADQEWEVVQSKEWRDHLENDFMLASDNLFGNDFEGQQF